MALVEVVGKVELYEEENLLLIQAETLVEYVIDDLEDFHIGLSSNFVHNSKERVAKCLTTLSIALDKINEIKKLSAV